jgi:hypothetical protein
MISAIIVFLAGAVVHILDKIDHSVRNVYDAGGRAERRKATMQAAIPAPETASVHQMVPRR